MSFDGVPVTSLRGATAIVGIGQTEFSKSSGRSELQLTAEATLAALDDAGLTTDDVDGMVTFTIDPTEDNDLMRTLGIAALGYSGRVRTAAVRPRARSCTRRPRSWRARRKSWCATAAADAALGRRFGGARATTEEPSAAPGGATPTGCCRSA